MSKSIQQHSFTVTSNEHGWKQTFTINKPVNLADPTWREHVEDDNMVNELAFGNMVIKLAAMLRSFKTANLADDMLAQCIVGGKKIPPPTILSGFDVNQQKEIQKANPTITFIFK